MVKVTRGTVIHDSLTSTPHSHAWGRHNMSEHSCLLYPDMDSEIWVQRSNAGGYNHSVGEAVWDALYLPSMQCGLKSQWCGENRLVGRWSFGSKKDISGLRVTPSNPSVWEVFGEDFKSVWAGIWGFIKISGTVREAASLGKTSKWSLRITDLRFFFLIPSLHSGISSPCLLTFSPFPPFLSCRLSCPLSDITHP